jgi:hypothetical protein
MSKHQAYANKQVVAELERLKAEDSKGRGEPKNYDWWEVTDDGRLIFLVDEYADQRIKELTQKEAK